MIFLKYHLKVLLGDFNARMERENIFTLITENESLIRIVVTVVLWHFLWCNFTTIVLVVKSTMFQHQNMHKYTWTSPNGKIHNQTDHILKYFRYHSSILDVWCFRGADCDTDHCQVVAKVRERLPISKKAAQKFDMEGFNLRELCELEVRKQYHTNI
jgi:hypothetical protein